MELPEVDEAQQLLAPLRALLGRDSADAERKLDVPPQGEPRKERGVLEDHGAIRTRPGHDLSRRGDRASDGLDQAGDEVQDSRLAAAGRTEQADELSGGDTQRDVLQRNGPMFAVRHPHSIEREARSPARLDRRSLGQHPDRAYEPIRDREHASVLAK